MNILFIVPYVPSLIRIRSYNLIRALSLSGNKVSVVTLWTEDTECDSLAELKKECHQVIAIHQSKIRSLLNVLVVLPSNIPLQAVYSWNPKLANEVVNLIHNQNSGNSFDIVHVEHLRGVRYGLKIKSDQKELSKKNQNKLPIIWDSVDSISLLFRQSANFSNSIRSRLISRFELNRTVKYERDMLNIFNRILVTSPVDKDAYISLINPPIETDLVSIIPNGVDLAYFTPGSDRERENETLVISGKMSYHANISMTLNFIENILPIIWEKKPNVKLWVVGKDPPKEISKHSIDPRITVTGMVEDIRPYLQKATIAVAPLTYGAGIQNKVLESMACSTPVITSSLATSALSVKIGEDLLAEDEPSKYAHIVTRLLDNPGYRIKIGLSGRRYVEKYHKWDSIGKKLEHVYQEVINNQI